MIKRLRHKFILINMLLVSLVLLVVFGAVFFSTYQNLTAESYNAIRFALSDRSDKNPPKLEMDRKHPPDEGYSPTAVFVVTLNAENGIESVNGRFVEVSEELAQSAVESALASDQKEGVLSSLNLRYQSLTTPDGVSKIAFADMTNENNSLFHLLITSLLVGLGGLTAFFFISMFLARWVLRPVEQSWNQQRQFVADASHELKTPLTVILANTGILLSHHKDTIDCQLKWVENTREEADRMKKLVDDMLFLAKSDASHAPTPHILVNFSDIVWNSILPFESVAFEQGVTINSEIAPNLSITGDHSQLKQLVAILLDNACKYAGDKGVVTFHLERLQDKIRLTVNNTGTPISPEHLPHLFERFYRADQSRAREIGGYGLGLAIAKSIVDKHKGRISVESTASSGTTFTVSFPLPHANEPPRKALKG